MPMVPWDQTFLSSQVRKAWSRKVKKMVTGWEKWALHKEVGSASCFLMPGGL